MSGLTAMFCSPGSSSQTAAKAKNRGVSLVEPLIPELVQNVIVRLARINAYLRIAFVMRIRGPLIPYPIAGSGLNSIAPAGAITKTVLRRIGR